MFELEKTIFSQIQSKVSASVIPKWIYFGNTMPMLKDNTGRIFYLYSIVLVSSVVRFLKPGKKYLEVSV